MKGIVMSCGYDSNQGFYAKTSDLKPHDYFKGETWIEYPDDIKEQLVKQFKLDRSWKSRLLYLFNPRIKL